MGMGSGTNQRTWVKHLRPRNLKFDSIAIGMFFFWSYCRIASLRHILLSCLIRIVLVKKRHVWHVA